MEYLPFTREPSFWEKCIIAARYPLDLVSRPFSALLSIPTLSIFVIPAFSSYTTTINFFFFYLTWAVLIRSNDPLKVELLGTLGIRIIFFLLPSLAFLAFDTASPSLAVAIKEHGEIALPLGKAQGGLKGKWWKIALVSTLNILLGVTLQVAVELLFTRVLSIRSALKISTAPPFPWLVAKDLILGLVIRECITYVLHRYVLHSPSSSSRLGIWHTGWQHSITAPFSFVAHYDHPIAYLVHVLLPTYLAAVFLRMHLLTYHLYLVVISLEELFAYSGYNVLPSGFILGGIARRQERHLMGEANGNYGCLGLSDLFMGTSVGGDLVDDLVDEAEKKQVGRRAKGKVKKIKHQAQEHFNSDHENSGDEDENDDKDDSEVADEPPEARPKSSRIANKTKPNPKSRKSDSSQNDEEQKRGEESGKTGKKSSSTSRPRRGQKSSDEGDDEVIVDPKRDSDERQQEAKKGKDTAVRKTGRKTSGGNKSN